jgi:hypothetical protein
VGFVVEKVALGQFSPSTSVPPANLHSTNFSTITFTYHPGLVQQASSGRSTQSPTTQIKKKKNTLRACWGSVLFFVICKLLPSFDSTQSKDMADHYVAEKIY